MTDLIAKLVADAPNLLPRLVRCAPGFFAGRLKRPIFLLGCPRSGKTVLAHLLGTHPDIAHYPDEANALWHPHLYPWRSSQLRRTVPPLWADPDAFAAGATASRTHSDVMTLKAAFGAYQMLRRQPAFLIESALIAFQIPFIRSEFPGARIVHLVRDGRSVAVAWARRQHAQMREYEEQYRSAGFFLDFDDVLDCCAASWNRHILEVSSRFREPEGLASGRHLELSYEAFCRQPRNTLLGLARDLDLDAAPFSDLAVDHIQDRNAADLAAIDSDCIKRIESRMEQALRLHGYNENRA